MIFLRSEWPRLTPAMLAELYRYGWNRRVLTYELFEDFCAEHDIVIGSVRLPKHHPGQYKIVQGRDYIKLDVNLREPDLTLTAWHEVGHYLFHVPAHFGIQTKTESVADSIAYAAVLPLHLIQRCHDWEIIEDYGYPRKYLRERRALYAIYGY